jgi:hypothetical protein
MALEEFHFFSFGFCVDRLSVDRLATEQRTCQ